MKHNKKRSVGIIFEQLTQRLSEDLVVGNRASAKKCLAIIKEHFSSGSELHREYRLLAALTSIEAESDVLIGRVLDESKRHCLTIDANKLRKEKTSLIRSINESFGQDFFDRKIAGYKTYATVQQLMDEWKRSGATTSPEAVRLEQRLINEIKSDRPVAAPIEDPIPVEEAGLSSLIEKLVEKKFAERHSYLTESQRNFLFRFVALEQDDRDESSRLLLVREARDIVDNAITALDEYLHNPAEKLSKFFVDQCRLVEGNIRGFRGDPAFRHGNIDAEWAEKVIMTIGLVEEIKHVER